MDIERALDILSKKTDESEIFLANSVSKKIEIKRGKIEAFKEADSIGYGIRVINNKKMGFAFSNELKRSVLEKALEVARIAEQDENLSLPEKQKYPKIKGGFDKRIVNLNQEHITEFIADLVDPCQKMKVTPTTGGIVWYILETKVCNSNGILGEEKSTLVSCYLNAVAKNNDTASGFYYDSSRNLDLDFGRIGEEAARLAKESLNAKMIGTKDVNVILKPHAASELLESALIPSFSADNIQRNRSYLQGKLKEKIFSPIDITDDGTMKDGLMTGMFDSEGVRTQKTPLVKKGVLEGYLYDTYCGKKDGTPSTGNAERDSYSALPRIDSSNFVVSGEGDIGEGLVVNGLIGSHTANPVTGDFSVETQNAFLKGVPVKKAIISGNIFDLLRKIEGFGKDYIQVSSVFSPSIEFADVRVIG